MFEYVLDTFGEGSSLYDKQCDEFRLIGVARTTLYASIANHQ